MTYIKEKMILEEVEHFKILTQNIISEIKENDDFYYELNPSLENPEFEYSIK